MELKHLLPLLIICTSGDDNIFRKAPSYILEKAKSPHFHMLDSHNMKRLLNYLEIWGVEDIYTHDEISEMHTLAGL